MIIIGIILLVTGGMITYQYLQGNTTHIHPYYCCLYRNWWSWVNCLGINNT